MDGSEVVHAFQLDYKAVFDEQVWSVFANHEPFVSYWVDYLRLD